MAEQRDRPHGNSNFVVEFGSGASRSGRTGFAEVVFAPFTIAERPRRAGAPRPSTPSRGAGERSGAASGSSCAAAPPARSTSTPGGTRRGAARRRARRVMNVKLLAEDHATVVWTWRFSNVRPVSLSYSPLRGVDGGILMETIELAFDDVEMA